MAMVDGRDPELYARRAAALRHWSRGRGAVDNLLNLPVSNHRRQLALFGFPGTEARTPLVFITRVVSKMQPSRGIDAILNALSIDDLVERTRLGQPLPKKLKPDGRSLEDRRADYRLTLLNTDRHHRAPSYRTLIRHEDDGAREIAESFDSVIMRLAAEAEPQYVDSDIIDRLARIIERNKIDLPDDLDRIVKRATSSSYNWLWTPSQWERRAALRTPNDRRIAALWHEV